MNKKIIFSFIGFYVIWLFVLPVVLSKTMVLLCKNYSYNSQYKIEILKPYVRLSFLPNVTIGANNLFIQDKKNDFRIAIKDANIKLRILPLLSGKIHVNTLNIYNIDLVTNLEKDLELDKNFVDRLKTLKLKCDSIKIGEFSALLKKSDIKNPIIYKGKGFNYERKNRYMKLKNNSTLVIDSNISKVVSNLYLPRNNDINKTIFDIEISNINIAPLKNYFKHYLPKDLEELRGDLSITANTEGLTTTLNNCAILMKDSAKSIIFPEKMYIKSRFKIFRNYVDFETIEIESKNIHAFIDGRISEYFGKTMPSLDFNIRLNKSRVEDIIKISPGFKIEELDMYKLKKYKFYGESLANFKIKGRLPEPSILGDIYINDAVLIKRISNTIKGATIKLNFNGKIVNFDVVVPTGGIEKVWVKGSQEIYRTKYANFIVKSTELVDLSNAQEVLLPLHEILNFILGPVPLMDLDGLGNIDILVKGNRKNPHIWGVFNIKNGLLNFKDIPDLVMCNAEIVLNFIDQKVLVSTKNGVVNKKDFAINGTSDLAGKFDINVFSQNQPLEVFYNSIRKSDILSSISKNFPNLDAIRGLIDFNLKIYGSVRNINDIEFNKNFFAKGLINLINSDIEFKNIRILKSNGEINIDGTNIDTQIDAKINDLPLCISSKIKNNFADIDLKIPKLNPNFLISDTEIQKKQYLPFVSVDAKYKGSIENIDLQKVNMNAKILGSVPNSPVNYQSNGKIVVYNNKLVIKKVQGFIYDKMNVFDIDTVVEDAFSKNKNINGQINIRIPDLKLLNDILATKMLPSKLFKLVKDYEFQDGSVNLYIKILNNKIFSNVDLAGIRFKYIPYEIPFDILNGSFAIKNNVLKLDKINLLADNMPVLLDGDIKDIFNKQVFNLYINSKPKQEFIDKYINKNQIYPIKIKGDIVYWVKLKGVQNNYDLKAQMDMSRDSSLYHFGATVGDVENAIVVSIDSKVIDKNYHKIKEFLYDKKIESQNGKQTRLNMVKAYGGVKILPNDLAFDNLCIKTSNPTDARIFNIIFRKPNIKQGQFTSDLKINGLLSNAKVLGDFHIFETNIPFLDTVMKNIELVFNDKTIAFNSKGEIIGNEITFDGVLKNKLTIPYKIEKASLYTKSLDLNQIVHKLKTAEVENVSTFESLEGFDLNSIIASNFKLKADSIQLRNLHATNFEAITSLNEKGILKVDDFSFDIAQGKLNGIYSYNINNNDINLRLKAESIDANDITWALFDLNNQIYGDLTGDISLACNGADFNQCMSTLSGNTIFNVKDGKMPKLGSLEYLLKAGNLVKGGFTGLSINSIIDILTPQKTGDFSDIYGSIRIKDGIARNIEITTQGDDLNLFIGGTYNFANSIADMEVLGLLSRKISTLLGPIGNVSLNTLFNVIPGVDLSKDSQVLERINKIPGIELSSKAFRKFIAEIKGNINGEDYVTSFKWIN